MAIVSCAAPGHGLLRRARLDVPTWIWFFLCGVVGLATSVAFVYITQYYTAGSWRPVKDIAEASKTGPATNIIAGTAVGFETTFVTAIVIGIALLVSFWLGDQAGLVQRGAATTSAASSAPPWPPWACS